MFRLMEQIFTHYQEKSRKKKIRLFFKLLEPEKETTLLDVGEAESTPGEWKKFMSFSTR